MYKRQDILRVEPRQLVCVKNGGALVDSAFVKHADEILRGEEFFIRPLGGPAKKRDIIEDSLLQVALREQILEGRIPIALGQLAHHGLLSSFCVANRPAGCLVHQHRLHHHRRKVQIDGRFPSERLIEQVVFRRGRQVFRAAHHVGDGHQVVVDHVGKIVSRQAVGLDEHVVIQRAAVHLHVPVKQVVKRGFALLRHVLADDIGLSRGNTAPGLLKAHVMQAVRVILVCFAPGLRLSAARVNLFRRAEAAVGAAALHQLPGITGIQATPLGLDIGAGLAADIRALVVVKPGLAHVFVDQLDGSLHLAFLIGVLNAQDKPATVFSGK